MSFSAKLLAIAIALLRRTDEQGGHELDHAFDTPVVSCATWRAGQPVIGLLQASEAAS